MLSRYSYMQKSTFGSTCRDSRSGNSSMRKSTLSRTCRCSRSGKSSMQRISCGYTCRRSTNRSGNSSMRSYPCGSNCRCSRSCLWPLKYNIWNSVDLFVIKLQITLIFRVQPLKSCCSTSYYQDARNG